MDKDCKYYEALGRYVELKERFDEALKKRDDVASRLSSALKVATEQRMYSALDIEKCEELFIQVKDAEQLVVRVNSELNEHAEVCGKPKIERGCFPF